MSGVEKKSNSSCWNLYTDSLNGYAFWEKAFSKKECEEIIKIAKDKSLTQGKVGKNTIKFEVRSSNICWLYSNDNLEWAFRRLTDIVLSLNNRFFQFDIFSFNEGLQFTNYKAPLGKYEKHIDRAFGTIVRKLSFSIQLTDPKEYEGGELQLHIENKPLTMKKEQGTLILFPSFTLHEVTPVTKGERNSLVGWVTGKQFK
jgi:PKHD-type hydroxylase